MKTRTDHTKEQQNATGPKIRKETGTKGTATINDKRPSTVHQRKLKETMDASAAAKAAPVQRKTNKTGLPDNLKSGIETLSGYAMDDVKVHYNSNKPAQLQAHAYAQGTDIHLASGQEQHLPHEAWHVVQQKQGRVKPTTQLKGKVNINDDDGLEKEADMMGAKALQVPGNEPAKPLQLKTSRPSGSGPVQRYKTKKEGLTVVGEFHSKSKEHRKVENQFAKFRKGENADPTDDFLWKENKKPGVQTKEVEKLRDNWFAEDERKYTASEDPKHLALSDIDRIKYYNGLLTQELDKEGSISDAAAKTYIKAMASALTDIENDASNAKMNSKDLTKKLKDLRFHDYADYIVTIISSEAYDPFDPKSDKKKLLAKQEGFSEVLAAADAALTRAYGTIETIPQGREISHNFIRTRAMHELANEKKDVQGIWVIGQYHVQEIQEHFRDSIEYDLVPMVEFNKDIREFVKAEEGMLKKVLSSDTKTYTEHEQLNVGGLYDRTNEISAVARMIKSSLQYFIDIESKQDFTGTGVLEEKVKSDIKFHVNRLVKGMLILADIAKNDLANIDFAAKIPGASENINKEVVDKIMHIIRRIGLIGTISHLHRDLKGTDKKALESPPNLLTYLRYTDVYDAAVELEKVTTVAK